MCNIINLSTMVGEMLKFIDMKCVIWSIYPPYLEKILKFTDMKCVISSIYLPWLERTLKFTDLKCHQFIYHGWFLFKFAHIKCVISSIYPPYLGKILKLTDLKCLNIINLSTMVGENFEIYWYEMSKYHQFIHHIWGKFWNLLT